MMFKSFLLFLVLFCCFFNTGFSQNQKLRFYNIGASKGLSQNSVRSIVQDNQGFIWIATNDGLNRFDGQGFKIYRKAYQAKNTLASNSIHTLIKDKNENLIMSNNEGVLDILNLKTDIVERFLPDLKNVQCTYLDKEGNLWIGNGITLFKYIKRNQTIKSYQVSVEKIKGHIPRTITSITQTSDGRVWVGTTHGNVFVLKFKGDLLTDCQLLKLEQNVNSDVKFLLEDQQKQLWVGTYGAGLFRWDAEQRRFLVESISKIHFKNKGIENLNLLSAAEDSFGRLWLGTENKGLFIYDPIHKTFENYKHFKGDVNSIGSNSINSILRDKKGDMWLGTADGGVSMVSFEKSPFEHFMYLESRNSLSNNIVNCFFQDSFGRIWIGTDGGGVNIFDEKGNVFQKLNPKEIQNDFIVSINEDAHHQIWLGTWGGGVVVIDPKFNYNYYKHSPNNANSINSNFAFVIFKDSKNRMWVGTYGEGLNLFDEDRNVFKHFVKSTQPNSLSSNFILSIAEDLNGQLWIGTEGGGLNRFDEYTNTFIRVGNNLFSSNSVGSIYPDVFGNLWLATNFGLNKYNPKTGQNKVFHTGNGLENDVIHAVNADVLGNIWFSTNKGISRISNDELIHNYFVFRGVKDNEFKQGSLRNKTGNLYFGGKDGFVKFDPPKIDHIEENSSVLFTDFKILNESISMLSKNSPLKHAITYTKSIEIPYHITMFSFEFAQLNFGEEVKKKYKYQLIGFDNQWHELNGENKVTFTKLAPGKYTLKVKGVNSVGEWLDQVTEMSIVIKPPFWLTWWFIALEVVVLIGIIILVFYIRLYSIKQRNLQLQKEVRLRTNELVSANEFLFERNEEIEEQNIKLEDSNKEIKRNIDKIIQQQQQILLQKQELENIVNDLELSNQSKDKLFSIIAHDLKNPITVLYGLSEELNKKFKKVSQEEFKQKLDNVCKAAKSVNDLVKNLLDWFRNQSQNIILRPEKINVHNLVVSNLFMYEMLIKNKNITVSLENLMPSHYISADLYMMDTVVRNLLDNSIKFSNRNGKIEISTVEKEDKIEIHHKDYGVGMSEEVLESLFNEKEHQLSVGTDGEIGTKLGLQIVKEFIEKNAGTMVVESEPEQGTSFIITLPKTKQSIHDPVQIIEYLNPKNQEFVHPYLPLLKGKKALIVEDNNEIRSYLSMLLSGVFEVFEAQNGIEGLSFLQKEEHLPDVILTDMMMPKMSGIEFCQQVKSNRLTNHIPIVLITGRTEEETQLASYEAGCDAFLPKPVNYRMLFQVMINLMKRQETFWKRFSESNLLYPEEVGYNRFDEEFMNKITTYIHEHINEADLNYKKLCDLTAMSRTILYSKLKVLTGMGVHDFIKSIRLNLAIELLQEGKFNVTQVAYEVGFHTPSYFSKSFQKRFGMSPKEYMLSIRNNV